MRARTRMLLFSIRKRVRHFRGRCTARDPIEGEFCTKPEERMPHVHSRTRMTSLGPLYSHWFTEIPAPREVSLPEPSEASRKWVGLQ